MVRREKNPQLHQAGVDSGFTLIEVMIALVVLAVGLLALAQLQVAAINGLTYSRHYSVATQLAEGQMEKLMAYPCSELYANSVNYYPKDVNGNDIVAQTTSGAQLSPFYDDMLQSSDTITKQAVARGNGKATRLWLPAPVNERGQPALPGENAYLVTWTVERGGSKGTPGLTGKTYQFKSVSYPSPGIPGPYQMRFVVTAIWFEKGQKISAKSPRSSFVDGNDNLIAGNRSTIEGMRELSAVE